VVDLGSPHVCSRFDQRFGPEALAGAIARLADAGGLRLAQASDPVGVPASTLVVPSLEAIAVRLCRGAIEVVRRPFGVRTQRGNLVINGRRETLTARPLFRDALASSRLVVPVVGFVEFTGPRGHRRAVSFGWGGALTWLAGLGVGEGLVVVTEDASWPVRLVHERQPVALAPDDASAWLAVGELPPSSTMPATGSDYPELFGSLG
jgi:putative SOS response-associated peptidase YedK